MSINIVIALNTPHTLWQCRTVLEDIDLKLLERELDDLLRQAYDGKLVSEDLTALSSLALLKARQMPVYKVKHSRG